MYKIFYAGQYDSFDPFVGDNLYVTGGSGIGTLLVTFQDSGFGPSRLTPLNGELYFEGDVPSSGGGVTSSKLWKSNGTAAGTVQIGNGSTHFTPTYLHNIDGTLFFANGGTAGQLQPFASDGTLAGTVQIATINGATGAAIYGITNVGGEASFFAKHGSVTDVWKSDGTPGGTSMVMSLAGSAGLPTSKDNFHEANSQGVFTDPRGEAEFQGNFYFGGSNAGAFSLVKSDGTNVTTLPLDFGTLGAQPQQLTFFDLATSALDPGNSSIPTLLFTAGSGGLWGTDGASVFHVNTALSASDLTVSGNRVFFSSQTINTHIPGLWELTNFGSGWNSNSIYDHLTVSNITDMGGGYVLFAGNDTTHGAELWTSDGTHTTMVKDIAVGSAGSDPQNLTDVGGMLYFDATTDGGATYTLWKSDGTSDGTMPVSAQAVDHFVPLAVMPDFASFTRPADFNGDRHSDIISVSSDGKITDTVLSGMHIIGSGNLGAVSGTVVALLGSGDFDGDGTNDLLLGNSDGSNNTVSVAHVVNSQVVSTNGLGTLAPQIKWQFEGIGDFNGDGVADVLWRDNASQGGTGHFLVWIISGSGTQIDAGGQDANIGTPTLTANFEAIGDFNGDGRSDILLNDQGTLETWEMNGTTITGGGVIGAVPAGTAFRAVGDFNGDGHSDLLFVDSNGAYSTLDINGTKIVGGGALGNPGPGYTFSAIGDYNNDGHSDILFKSVVNPGSYLIWQMDDTTIGASGAVGAGPIDGGHFGDFDGDGKADLLWRDNGGTVATWQMNGGTVAAGNFITGVTSDWHIMGTGDVNGDHRADVIWLNDDGSVIAWEMASSSAIGSFVGLAPQPLHDTFAGIGDVDGDGKSDLLWRNDTTGEVTVRTSAGAEGTISGVGQDWSLVGMGDFNGDGKDDVLFRHQSDGLSAYWQMNGTSATTTTFLPGVPTNWHVVGTGNFDGDANHTADVFWHNDNGANAVWLMGSTGQVQQAFFFSGVSSDWHVIGTGDVDGDGKDDVIWRADSGATAVWKMDGGNAPTVAFPGGVPADWATNAHHYDYV